MKKLAVKSGGGMHVATTRSSKSRVLSGINYYRIEGNLRTINLINNVLAGTNARIHAAADVSQDVQLLKTIPDVGEDAALALSSVIDDVKRFPNSASLVTYFGLAPSVRSSVDVTHHGRITKKGDKLVRHMLVKTAHTHVMYESHSRLSQFHWRVKAKRDTFKAAVAAASKMLCITYQMLKNWSELQLYAYILFYFQSDP